MTSMITPPTSPGEREQARWRSPAGRALARGYLWLEQRLGPHGSILLPLLVGLAVFLTATWAAGEVYVAVEDRADLALLDQPVLEAMVAIRSAPLTVLAIGFTQTGGPIGMPIVATLIAVALSWRWRSRTPIVLLAIAAAGSLTATVLGKRLIGRVRPPLADALPPYEYSPSFPSGHTLNATVIAGIIAYLLILRAQRRRTRLLIAAGAVLYVLAMGSTRLYLGHHWFSDVLVAYLLGAAWLAVVITVHRLLVTSWAARHARRTLQPEVARETRP